MNSTIYIDNSELTSLVMGDLIYAGTVKIYQRQNDKTKLIKSLHFDPDKGGYDSPESEVEAFVDTLTEGFYEHAYGDPDDDKIPEFGAEFTCLELYWKIDVVDGKICGITCLSETKEKCKCQCGHTVYHLGGPIPGVNV